MNDSQRQAELMALFKELARALTMLRELTRILESAARKLTELEKQAGK